MTTRARKKSTTKKSPTKPVDNYLCCFSFDEPDCPDWSGTFQIIMEATGPEQAVDRCRTRLRRLRTSSSMFDSPITIYIEGIIKLVGSFKRGVVVNWHSRTVPGGPPALVTNLIPDQESQDVEGFAFRPDGGEDEDTVVPFIDFGGMALRRAIRAAVEGDHDGPGDDDEARRQRERTLSAAVAELRKINRERAAASTVRRQ